MIFQYFEDFLKNLGNVNPGPFFVLSLIPYLAFLYWAQKTDQIPLLSLWGFRLTLLFVFMTIVLAIAAEKIYGGQLTDVDTLHGAAEAFLTLSDALVVVGFALIGKKNLMKNS